MSRELYWDIREMIDTLEKNAKNYSIAECINCMEKWCSEVYDLYEEIEKLQERNEELENGQQ